MVTILWIIIIILIALGILIFWAISVINTAIKMEEDVNSYYNRIGMGVDKRFKILKQGLSIMSKHNENFKKTYESIIGKRKKEENYIEKEKDIRQALKEIDILVERYPEIGKVFDSETLIKDMKEIENEIFTIQGEYNSKAKSYNAYIRSIPNNIVLAGKMLYPYFEIKEDDIDTKKDFTI